MQLAGWNVLCRLTLRINNLSGAKSLNGSKDMLILEAFLNFWYFNQTASG